MQYLAEAAADWWKAPASISGRVSGRPAGLASGSLFAPPPLLLVAHCPELDHPGEPVERRL